jgi:sulfur-carrier protein
MKLLYFARIREQIGLSEEQISPPATVGTIGELIDWLKTRGENYSAALENDRIVRVAIDRNHVESRSAPIDQATEIALFPPMTGG